jgi:GlcNAc-P-P-Und epimerase
LSFDGETPGADYYLGDIAQMTSAIVFGGSGFIGSHFLKRLSEAQRYDALYSVDIAAPRFTTAGVRYVEHDVREPIQRQLFGEGPFDIFNLAAVHTTPGHEDWEYYWTNVNGATNICAFASVIRASYVLFTSTMMVYGPTETAKDEDGALEPVNAYGRSKILAERIHRQWQAESPETRRVTIVRPGVIYGLAEQGNFTRLSKALRQRRFVYPGRTDTIKACGYVADLVSSMMQANERNHGVLLYNFCHPERYTSQQICQAFCEVAGYREPRIVVPMWLLQSVAAGFELLKALGFKTDINRARVRKLYQSTNMVPKTLPEIGFQYQYDLVAGLRQWKQSSQVTDFD